MFGGHWELLIVVFVALLLFGHRLPSVMRSLGRGVVEFKRGVHGVEDEIEEATSTKSVSRDSSSEDVKFKRGAHGVEDDIEEATSTKSVSRDSSSED